MSGATAAESLLATVSALRARLVARLGAGPLAPEAKREMERALAELDLMREALQAEAARLVREMQRYAEFFEYAPDACVITDAGGSLREANRAALELLGAPREELIGRPLAQYIAAHERIAFNTRSVGLLLGGKTGSSKQIELSVRPLELKQCGGGLCWLLRPLAGAAASS